MKTRLTLCCVALLWMTGCGDREVPAAELGQARFSDPSVSTSHINRFSCATCHVVDPTAPLTGPPRYDSGYNLAGAPTRGSWWGGGSITLLDAINVCLKEFMGGRALNREDEVARQLDAYLEANTPAAGTPAPFTVVRTISPLATFVGDAARGAEAYQKGCARCHGEAHTGKGRSLPAAVVIPESSQATFRAQARDVTVEKIRHGRFFNVGGIMPFYTLEAMSDQTVADLLTYMGL